MTEEINLRTNYTRDFSENIDETMALSEPLSKYTNDDTPNKLTIHLALLTAQVIFGLSAVVGTIGLPSFHPLTFALIRESCATVLLLTTAHCVSIRAGREEGILSGSLEDWPKFLISGTGIFASQAFYIIGIKLSSAVAASVWQPSQPIITASVCMMFGWEPFSGCRCAGIFVAFFGCAIMVLGGGGGGGEAIGGGGSGDNGAFSTLMGQCSFFINCMGGSLYVLSSKTLIKTGRYESIAVTAWSYTFASVQMTIFAVLMSFSKSISVFLCTDCTENIWHVPRSAIPAMVFFVIMTSSCSYGLITWANKYASGTLVIGYTVTQPIASAIVIQLLVSLGLYAGCAKGAERFRFLADDTEKPCLDQPDKYTGIGAIGVIIGLMVIIFTEPQKQDKASDSDTEYPDFEENEALLELSEMDKALDYDSEEN